MSRETKAKVEDAPQVAEPKPEPKQEERLFWNPQSRQYLVTTVDPDGRVQFDNHQAVLDPSDPGYEKGLAILTRHHSFNKLFYEVVASKNDKAMRVKMQAMLRQLLEHDEGDDVERERGIVALAGLFTDAELDGLGTSRGNPNVDVLVQEAVENKKIKGMEL